MKDSGDRQGSVEYRHGTLGAKAEVLLEGLNALSRKVDDGFGRQRQEVNSDVEKQNQGIDAVFRRHRKKIKSDFEKQSQRIAAVFRRHRKKIKSEFEKQSQRIDASFRRHRKKIKSDVEKQNQRIEDGFKENNKRLDEAIAHFKAFPGKVMKWVSALVAGLIVAAAGAYFTGLF